MKPPHVRDGSRPPGEFVRHYHRSDTASHTTWNEWIDRRKPRPTRHWLKVAIVVIAVLVLGATLAALIIEMRPI